MKIHIGNKIKSVYKTSGISIGELSTEIGTVRQNVYKIFNKKEINTDTLFKLSKILKHDFFSYYSTELNIPQNTTDNENYKLQVDFYKKENLYLKEINQLLRDKLKKVKK